MGNNSNNHTASNGKSALYNKDNANNTNAIYVAGALSHLPNSETMIATSAHDIEALLPAAAKPSDNDSN